MSEQPPLSPRTLAAQALRHIDERTRAIVPPIHLATTFERDPDNLYRSGNSYGRPDNDTVREAEALIGALEGASTTFVFGSGMSAAIALFLSLGPGAHVIAPTKMYWALRAWLANAIKPELGRRSAVEPVIGHAKAEHRMGRNFLKGPHGDAANAVLAAAGYNFRRLLAWLAIL